MTDFTALVQADRGQPARTIHLVVKSAFDVWLLAQPPRARAAVAAQSLTGETNGFAILPGDGADDWSVAAMVADPTSLTNWCLAALAQDLPAGAYRLADGDPGAGLFGWLIAQHRYDRYKSKPKPTAPRVLLTRDVAHMAGVVAEAGATALVRDLVDTPANDMGPAELEAAAEALTTTYGARMTVTRGDALEQGFPLVAAVGQAAARGREPRLIELVWGRESDRRIAIVGKGVTFDSGGLDIKPASGMLNMKKDMGGAAHALGLAQLIMGAGLPVRLHLLIPAVENSIAGNAMRPGDVLRSRKGLSVEIDNTDAEGRLILADALSFAAEAAPELIVDFATLTGAARVALGPDLPALFANDDALAADLLGAGTRRGDPLWRLPLWDGYDTMLNSDIADLTNAPAGGFAGSITAALFLRRFVPAAIPWAHLDTFAWTATAKPGRPKGGAALGLRAVWSLLQDRNPH